MTPAGGRRRRAPRAATSTGADRRGWRLGGAVAYGALTLARLGIPTAALIGADAEAAPCSGARPAAAVRRRRARSIRSSRARSSRTSRRRVAGCSRRSRCRTPCRRVRCRSPGESPTRGCSRPWRASWTMDWASVPPADGVRRPGLAGIAADPGSRAARPPRSASSVGAPAPRRISSPSARDDLAPDIDLRALGALLRHGAERGPDPQRRRRAAAGRVRRARCGRSADTRRRPPIRAIRPAPVTCSSRRSSLRRRGATAADRDARPDARRTPVRGDRRRSRCGGCRDCNGVPDASAVRRRLRAELVARGG